MNFEKIAAFYQTFDDSKIERIALTEAGDLEPEVVSILRAEIKRRSLSPSLLNGIDAQISSISAETLAEVKNRIINLPCPECSRVESKLQGAVVRIVVGYILITNYQKISIISCEICKNELIKKALLKTVLLGWWEIPWGLFKTPYAILMTFADFKKSDSISDKIITNFITENIGLLKANWNSSVRLIEIIKKRNQSS